MLLKVLEKKLKCIIVYHFKRLILLSPHKKKAMRSNNSNKLHCLIMPMLLEVLTSEKRPKNVEVEVRGQKSRS